jgi:hypothetical protein
MRKRRAESARRNPVATIIMQVAPMRIWVAIHAMQFVISGKLRAPIVMAADKLSTTNGFYS